MESVYIHEAGHAVIGHQLGIREDGIVFGDSLPDDEAAQARYAGGTPITIAKRALAGLLAEIELTPTNVPASTTSIIFSPEDLSNESIPLEERTFLSGGSKDLETATYQVSKVIGADAAAVRAKLLDLEQEVKSLVIQHASTIQALAKGVAEWHQTADPEVDSMPDGTLIYSPTRLMAVIG